MNFVLDFLGKTVLSLDLYILEIDNSPYAIQSIDQILVEMNCMMI